MLEIFLSNTQNVNQRLGHLTGTHPPEAIQFKPTDKDPEGRLASDHVLIVKQRNGESHSRMHLIFVVLSTGADQIPVTCYYVIRDLSQSRSS